MNGDYMKSFAALDKLIKRPTNPDHMCAVCILPLEDGKQHKDNDECILKLQSHILELRRYVQHTPKCDVTVVHYAMKPKCTCGLEELDWWSRGN